VLDTIVQSAAPQAGSLVLDIGTGTGNVAERFMSLGCHVWGIDFSAEMLTQAQVKLPEARFVQADILGVWPDELQRRFDRIAAAYVLHEFDLQTKVAFIQRLIQQHLAPKGWIVIGDIAFPTTYDREQARQQWRNHWDDAEYYWAADEALAALEYVGLQAEYIQVSWCAGVFVVPSPAQR